MPLVVKKPIQLVNNSSRDIGLCRNAEEENENFYNKEDKEKESLLLQNPRQKKYVHNHRNNNYIDESPVDWLRLYWLGFGLFLVLFPFWILDTLKDPMFGALTSGNLERHQPPAKMLSVCTTLLLVCLLEMLMSQQKKQKELEQSQTASDEVLDSGGRWSKMSYRIEMDVIAGSRAEDRVPNSIFTLVGVPYCIAFGIMAYLLQFNRAVSFSFVGPKMEPLPGELFSENKYYNSTVISWHVLGYFLYAAIESFGSIAVACFWSFTNSTLSLHDAERYYGPVIAIAQLGAIAGSTMVTTHVWSNVTLVITACLTILLHVLVMNAYSRRFPPTNHNDDDDVTEKGRGSFLSKTRAGSHSNSIDQDDGSALWSGVYLILRHNYVLLILGVSCLYEVSLTCLNYQMTLLGWSRFEQTESKHEGTTMSFTQFMGHYGQLVNICSLVLSSTVFPVLIRRLGLRWTLRLFPTLLLLTNILAFGPLPGNLWLLFVSLSCLKAITYSIHDPSKELLYLPTSNAIKFRAKFWIDVVGARVAKAFGSTINTIAGSVDRSIHVASAPSLLTAAALWLVCFSVGNHFERLIETNTVVGLYDDDDDCMRRSNNLYESDRDDVDFDDDDNNNNNNSDLAEEEIGLELQTSEKLLLSPDADAAAGSQGILLCN